MKTKITIMLVLFLVITSAQTQADLIWESGHHVFSEGYEAEIDMLNSATADITGGEIGILRCQHTSEVDVYDGSEIELLRPHDSSTANVHGGIIDYLFTLGNSNTNIYRGLLYEIAAKDLSIINMYVESYEWDADGGFREGGIITGIWIDSSETFSIDLVSEDTINHIEFIPEPCSFVLLTIGWFVSRKRKSIR